MVVVNRGGQYILPLISMLLVVSHQNMEGRGRTWYACKNRESMVMFMEWRENGHVTEEASLKEGEWS